MEIVELRPSDTHVLRSSVLRNGTASDVVEFDGDELPTTFHLGLRADGSVVAVSSWLERRHPDFPERSGVQLRGMAVEPALRGRGLGARLLDAGIARCRAAEVEVVWARARDSALGFYERHGFESVGAGYVDVTTGLPHHDIVRWLSP